MSVIEEILEEWGSFELRRPESSSFFTILELLVNSLCYNNSREDRFWIEYYRMAERQPSYGYVLDFIK